LRTTNWVPRRKDNDPKTIAAARAEALRGEETAPPSSPSTPLKRSESRESVNASQDIRHSRDNVPLRSTRSEEWQGGQSSGRGRGRFSDKVKEISRKIPLML
jgi:hypothetical protein